MELPDFVYRIAYADTDAGGIVYHSRYFDIAERSRNDCLSHFGYSCKMIQQNYDIVFVVNKVNIVYRRPAFLDDLLHVRSKVVSYSGARMIWETIFKLLNTDICSLTVHLAGISYSRKELTIIPNDILELLYKVQKSIYSKRK